jgi:predicted flap endonuclease-1-like 5' DNA nuclease
MTESTLLILAALVIVALVILILRSRSRDKSEIGHHIDTSVTAVGAATEAVRNIVEEVAHRVEETLAPDEATSSAAVEAVQPVTKKPAVKKPAVEKSVASKPAATKPAASKPAAKKVNEAAVAFTAIGVPAAVGAPDDLRLIKGLGPKLNAVLTDLGVTRFDQIAAWNDDEVVKVDAHLGTFKGRIARDNWIEQAKLLASDDTAGFEAKFGKLDKPGQA